MTAKKLAKQRMNNEEHEALRAERAAVIMASKPYQTGERLSRSAIAHMLKIDCDEVRWILGPMVRDGQLVKWVEKNKSWYKAPDKNLCSVDFRVDNDIYELIAQLERGW